MAFPRFSGRARRVDKQGECSHGQKAQAVQIVEQSGQSIAQVARDLDLTASALRQWVKQSQIDRQPASTGALTTQERAGG